jgi:uncharacterized protein YkwD
MRTAVVLAVAILATLVAAPTAAPDSSTKVERRLLLESAVIREMNRIRVAEGLRTLRASPSLRTAARGHSRSMLEFGFFSHDSVDGTAFSDRIRRYYSSRGWRSWSVGETLLASSTDVIDAKEIVAAWLDSPPHREVILDPTWREAGIGALYTAIAPKEYRGAQTIVVTADFGMREGKLAPA